MTIADAKLLKSGDLEMHAERITDKERLIHNQGLWVKACGPEAYVIQQTYGVVMHGILTATVKDPLEMTGPLLAENSRDFGKAAIAHIKWLAGPHKAKRKQKTSMIVAFAEPEDANRAIDQGLVWAGERHSCEYYEPKCLMLQCKACQHYGHMGNRCRAPVKCVICAETHPKATCPERHQPSPKIKCAVCNGHHQADSPECVYRQKELQRIAQARRDAPPRHPIRKPPGAMNPRKETEDQVTSETEADKFLENLGSRVDPANGDPSIGLPDRSTNTVRNSANATPPVTTDKHPHPPTTDDTGIPNNPSTNTDASPPATGETALISPPSASTRAIATCRDALETSPTTGAPEPTPKATTSETVGVNALKTQNKRRSRNREPLQDVTDLFSDLGRARKNQLETSNQEKRLRPSNQGKEQQRAPKKPGKKGPTKSLKRKKPAEEDDTSNPSTAISTISGRQVKRPKTLIAELERSRKVEIGFDTTEEDQTSHDETSNTFYDIASGAIIGCHE